MKMAPRTRRLKNRTFAVSESVPPLDREKIKRWVQHNGGLFSKEIGGAVTHCIVSKQDFKDYTPLGKSYDEHITYQP